MKDYVFNDGIADESKPLFSVLLDLLEFFQDFCKKNNLKCFAVGGTLLGAIRHDGFIPWDDDIDVGMLRKDYDKLLELIKDQELPVPYKFLTPETDLGYGKGFIRLTNENTTAISANSCIHNFNHGMFIDVFPLDAIPDNKLQLFIYKKRMEVLTILRGVAGSFFSNVGTGGTSLKSKVFYYMMYPLFKCRIVTTAKIFRRMNKVASKYENSNTTRIGQSTFWAEEKFFFYREDYERGIVPHKFESIYIDIPAGFDRVLRVQYGDYKTPVKMQSYHGDTIFDCNTPYKEYIKSHKNELLKKWEEYIKTKKSGK